MKLKAVELNTFYFVQTDSRKTFVGLCIEKKWFYGSVQVWFKVKDGTCYDVTLFEVIRPATQAEIEEFYKKPQVYLENEFVLPNQWYLVHLDDIEGKDKIAFVIAKIGFLYSLYIEGRECEMIGNSFLRHATEPEIKEQLARFAWPKDYFKNAMIEIANSVFKPSFNPFKVVNTEYSYIPPITVAASERILNGLVSCYMQPDLNKNLLESELPKPINDIFEKAMGRGYLAQDTAEMLAMCLTVWTAVSVGHKIQKSQQ